MHLYRIQFIEDNVKIWNVFRIFSIKKEKGLPTDSPNCPSGKSDTNGWEGIIACPTLILSLEFAEIFSAFGEEFEIFWIENLEKKRRGKEKPF